MVLSFTFYSIILIPGNTGIQLRRLLKFLYVYKNTNGFELVSIRP